MSSPLNPVNWFEIPVYNLKRAKEFYEHVFGYSLALNEMDLLQMAWFPMSDGTPGASGTLIKAEHYTPSYSGTVVYFSVADIDETLLKVIERGGKTIMPKSGIGQYGFVAHFEDCEGNRIGLHAMQ